MCAEADKDIFETYDIARKCIEHENTLVNGRINSTLVLHGFLLTSFGFMLNARINNSGYEEIKNFAAVMLPLFALIGVLTSLVMQFAVEAGGNAINCVRWNWERFVWTTHKDDFEGVEYRTPKECKSKDEKKQREKFELCAEEKFGHSRGVPGLTDGSHKQQHNGSPISVLYLLFLLWTIIFIVTMLAFKPHHALMNLLS